MKEKLLNLLFFLVVALLIYFIINIFHLSWYIANPEGFFGFTYFIEILSTVFMLLLFVFLVILVFRLLINALISFFRKKETRKNLLKIFGAFLFILVFYPLQYAIIRGANSFFSFNLAEKYSLINKTDRLLKSGEFEEALELAIKSYNKEKNRELGWFFVFTKLYNQTDFDKKEKLFSQYKATINYGYCLKETLKSEESERVFKEAILIAKSPLLFENQNNLLLSPTLYLAEINLNRQNFKVADNYFKDYSVFLSDSESEDIEKVISSYQLFIDQALIIGDLKKAAKLHIECLQLFEQSELSKDSSSYLYLLLGASLSELSNENFTNAANLLLKSAPIAKEKDDKPIYLSYLSVKARYCLIAGGKNQGNEKIIEKGFLENLFDPSDNKLSIKERMIQEAEVCHKDIVKKYKAMGGEQSSNYLHAIVDQGNFYYLTSQFEKAKEIFDKALVLIRLNINENKELYYKIITLNLKIKSFKNKIDLTKLDEVEGFIFEKLNLKYLILTEEEKEKYVFSIQLYLDFINEFYITNDSDLSRKRLYNNIISVKNVALSSNSVLRDYIRNSGNEMKSLFEEILYEKKKISTNSMSYNSLKKAEHINAKEKQLLEKIYNDPKFKKYLPKSINWRTIRDSLKKNEVAIEIFNLPFSEDFKKGTQYFALMIHHESKSPRLIKLFKESELKGLLNVNGNTKKRVNIIYNINSKKLYNLVFAPIEKYLSDNSIIYLSKSGILHNISIPAILKEKNWAISLLGSTKQIISRNELKKVDKIVLFGGVEYNSISDTVSSKKRGNDKFNYKTLKYTKEEVLNISKLFLNYKENSSKILTDNEASEKAFRALSGSKTSIIHLATHGYYNNSINSNLSLFNNNQLKPSPLMKSGLLLAGANNPSFYEGENDGNLTSLEISELDFSNVDLVLLSACESGLGDVLGSEGVFGLQRAFKIAGVKSLIVSLWQVPDKQTSELMYKFYTYYLEGSTKRDALQNAQKDIRSKYSNPYYWAGFELIE
jgi:CHAT domain-containing protein